MSKKCADTQDDYCNPPPTLGLIKGVHVGNFKREEYKAPTC